jgi:DNA-binding GntR family transcriptional regulator
VVRLGPADVRDIYLSRAFLETGVLRRLARDRVPIPEEARAANVEIRRRWDASSFDIVDPDMRFHTCLIDAAGNVRTSRMYRCSPRR